MARIEIDPNYTGPTFSRATAPTDPFKKEDVQNLAAAVSTHIHDGVHGLPMVAASIPPNLITASMLADGSVTSSKILDGTIVSADLAAGTLVQANMAALSIGTPQLIDASVTSPKLAANLSLTGNLTVSGGSLLVPGGLIAAGAPLSGTAGDLSSNRGANTGYVFLGNAAHYMGFDGTNYQMPSALLFVNGLQVATVDQLVATARLRTGQGIFVGTNIGPGQGSQVSVVFSSPMPGVPAIAIAQVKGGSDQSTFTVQVESPTANGFQAHCQNLSNSQTSNCVINYIAVFGSY